MHYREDLHARGTCMVHRDIRATFLSIPKNALTSIRSSTGMDFSPTFVPNDLVYTVLRNPLDRFVSGYIEIFKPLRDSDWSPSLRYIKGLDLKDQLDSVIMELYKGNYFDPHIIPQSFFLSDKNNKPYPVNIFLDHANLNAQYKTLFGIDLPYKQVNDSVNTINIKNKLTHDQHQLLAEIYSEDVKLYDRFSK
jgi:hypothetical protein